MSVEKKGKPILLPYLELADAELAHEVPNEHGIADHFFRHLIDEAWAGKNAYVPVVPPFGVAVVDTLC